MEMPETTSETNKIEQVMHEYKLGKLKTPSGKIVTDKAQAVAIALQSAGVSAKSLERTELVNKIRVQKSILGNMIAKAEAQDANVREKLFDMFSSGKPVDDKMIHAFAEESGLDPSVVEGIIYEILQGLMAGGKSAGKKDDVDPDQLAIGIKTESEHTDEPEIAEKIARDHIAEDKEYYTKLQAMESGKTPPADTAKKALSTLNIHAAAETYSRMRDKGQGPEEVAGVMLAALRRDGFQVDKSLDEPLSREFEKYHITKHAEKE
jgi:hypothetical protein